MSIDFDKSLIEFALRLKQLRELHGKSTGGKKIPQKRAAELIDTSPVVWYRWENGSFPDVKSLIKIAMFFNVSLDWLVLGKGEPHGIPAEVYDSLSDIRKSIQKIDAMTKKSID